MFAKILLNKKLAHSTVTKSHPNAAQNCAEQFKNLTIFCQTVRIRPNGEISPLLVTLLANYKALKLSEADNYDN